MPPKTEAENITFLLQCLACATQNGGKLDYKALGALHNNATANAISLRLGRVKKSVNFTDPFAAGGEANTFTPTTAGPATTALLQTGAYAPTTPPVTKPKPTAPVASVAKEKGYGVKRKRAADEEDLLISSTTTSTSPPPPPAPPSSPVATTTNKGKGKAEEEEHEEPTLAPAATKPRAKRAKGAKKGQEMDENMKKMYAAAIRAADLEVLGAGWVMGNGDVVKPYGEEEGEEKVELGEGVGV